MPVQFAGKFDPSLSNLSSWYQSAKELPEWAQKQSYAQTFGAPKSETAELLAGIKDINAFMNDPAVQKRQLENALAFQKEQMKQAAPYKLLFDMPGQVAQAMLAPGQIRLAGVNAANQVISEGLRSAAGVQVPFNYQRPNIQYF